MLLPVARPRCRSSPYQPAYTWARTKATPRRPMKFRPHIHSRDERCREENWGIRRIGQACQHMRSHARGIESPRAPAPYMAGCEFSNSTVLRTAALQSKSKPSLAAYGAGQPTIGCLAQRQLPGGGPPGRLRHRLPRRSNRTSGATRKDCVSNQSPVGSHYWCPTDNYPRNVHCIPTKVSMSLHISSTSTQLLKLRQPLLQPIHSAMIMVWLSFTAFQTRFRLLKHKPGVGASLIFHPFEQI